MGPVGGAPVGDELTGCGVVRTCTEVHRPVARDDHPQEVDHVDGVHLGEVFPEADRAGLES
ncbi:hypothetical protein EB118_18210 [bacterium]|nr:hypothetical protein [bacterium]